MKRILALLLTAVLCMSLAACGSGASQQSTQENKPDNTTDGAAETTPEPEEKTYHFGDTITTDLFEFTPEFGGFASKVGNKPNSDILTPEGSDFSGNPYEADDEKTMMYFSGTVKYIGNSKSDERFLVAFTVDYDDGYIFSEVTELSGEAWSLDGSNWESGIDMTFEPLSSQKDGYVRFCIEVPEQLETNTDKIVVIFNISGNNYKFQIG